MPTTSPSEFLPLLRPAQLCLPLCVPLQGDQIEKPPSGRHLFLATENDTDVTPKRALKKRLHRYHRAKRPVSRSNIFYTTRARKLAAIKSFFNYLVENEGLEVNPAASIRSPRIPEKEPEYLTEEECIRLLETIARKGKSRVRERDMAIAVLFLHTGLRVSELTTLKLINVDLDRDQIKITRKGNKEQYLHLNGETINMLARYLANRPEAENSRFFTGNNGGNLDRGYIYSIVRRYLELAGIDKDKHGPHLFRHTFCTRLHQKGAGPFVIKDLAGHKSLNTTMRYVRIENKEQAEAIDRLEFGAAITPPLSS